MTRNSSKAEDERKGEEQPDRVTKEHGGQVVEAIAPEDLKSFNDADCKHERFIRDPSETEFIVFTCANPNCAEVIVYSSSKPK